MNTAGSIMDFVLVFTVVLVSMPVLIHFAPRLGLLDRPSARKRHEGQVPMVGGLALFLGLFLVLGLRYVGDLRLLMLMSGSCLVVAAGYLDDRLGLSAKSRFAVQTGACALMVFGAGVYLENFGELLWPATLHLGWLAVPITLFCVVGVTNAINMIDGMDGLSASISLVCLAALVAANAFKGGGLLPFPEIPALAGGLCAYLLFNLRLPWRAHALAFFGDAGTLLLGFALGWLLVESSQGETRIIAPVTALWLLAVPLMDTVFVMIKRWRAGRPVTAADQEHLHHAFLRSGWRVGTTLAAMVTLAAVLAFVGLGLEWLGVPEYVSYALFLALCAAYYTALGRAWSAKRFLGREIG